MSTDPIPVKRRHFTREELSEFAQEHLSYEMGMAAHLATHWRVAPALLGPVSHSAFLVATLVHLRLLDDFVNRTERPTHDDVDSEGRVRSRVETDDVLAVDYLPSWTPRERLPRKERRAVNAQVAHLSMRRTRGRPWDAIELARTVLGECDRFLSELEREDPEYAACLEAAGQLVERFLLWADEYDDDWYDSDRLKPRTETAATTSATLITELPLHAPPARGS